MRLVLTLLNDTREVLNATRKIPEEMKEAYKEAGVERTGLDVELGRFFSLSGYNLCRLFGVSLDNRLYRITTFIVDNKWYGEISVKENFEFDHKVFEDPSTYNTTVKIKDNSAELDELHRDIFIKALQVENYDEVFKFSEDDKLPEEINSECMAIYSPILSF